MPYGSQRPREPPSELKAWKSSYAFTEDKQERIQTLLDEAISDMGILNRKILGVPENVKALERKRGIDAKRIAILSSATSIVKRLSTEIVERVFLFVNGDEAVILPSSKSGNFTPWILGHVCARWRSILWESSSMWSQISFQRSYGQGSRLRPKFHIREAFNHVLMKTSTTISLTCGESEFKAVFDIALSNSKRFKNITLRGLHTELLSVILEQPSAWENLDSLDIRLTNTWNAEQNNTTSCFQTAPNLRTVVLSSDTTIFKPQLFLLPWDQLLELQISRMYLPAAVVYTTLEQCPRLVSTQLYIQCDTTIPNHGIITLPRLHKLGFVTSHRHVFDWDLFLRLFIAPSMTHMTLNSKKVPIPAIVSFLRRSSCSLQEFTIDTQSPYENHGEIKSLLNLLPNIRKLTLSWIIPSSIIQGLQGKPHWIFPLLTHGCWRVDPSGLAKVLEMVGEFMSYNAEHEHERLDLSIGCYEGPGFKDVERAYLLSYPAYESCEWLHLSVYNASTSHAIIPESMIARSF